MMPVYCIVTLYADENTSDHDLNVWLEADKIGWPVEPLD